MLPSKNQALEVRACDCTYYSWLEGRCHLALFQVVPVGAAKELVLSDVSLQSKALLRLPHKQLRHKQNQGYKQAV